MLAAKTSRAVRCRAVLAKRIHKAASKQGGNKAFMPMDVTCLCPAPASSPVVAGAPSLASGLEESRFSVAIL